MWVEGLREISSGGTPTKRQSKLENRKSFSGVMGKRSSIALTPSSSTSTGSLLETDKAADLPRSSQVPDLPHPDLPIDELRKRDKFKEKIKVKKEEVAELSKDIKHKLKPSSSPPPSLSNFLLSKPDQPIVDEKQQLIKENQEMQERISKYEETIRKLKLENQQLRSQLATTAGQPDEDDYDRKRREAELTSLKDKLQHETSFRKDLQRQLVDTKEELKNLKLSFHTVNKLPSLTTSRQPSLPSIDPSKKPIEKTLSVPNFASLTSSHSSSSPAVHSSMDFNLDELEDVTDMVQSEMVNSRRSSSAVFTPSQPPEKVKWVPDNLVNDCSLCNVEFGFFTRKVCFGLDFLYYSWNDMIVMKIIIVSVQFQRM